MVNAKIGLGEDPKLLPCVPSLLDHVLSFLLYY